MIRKLTGYTKGQAVVEYGLILVITLLLSSIIIATHNKTETAMEDTLKGHTSDMNPKAGEILTPDPVKPEDVINIPDDLGGDFTYKPIAHFSIQNPAYLGEKIEYWDSSYAPDGYIVEREWTGKVDRFTTEGTHQISLTVTDNNGLQDTYTLTVNVVKREEYKRIVHDIANEQKKELQKGPLRIVDETERILDHIYGKRKDRYGVDHTVIEKSYHEHVVERVRDITYEIKIPLVEVTYDFSGTEISRTPYLVNGEPQFVTRTEIQTVPEPSDIKVNWVDNVWTFYVYDQISSVRDPKNSWGERNPDVDYPRYVEGKLETTQSPETKTSRTSRKNNRNNAGYNAPSTKCPTCTIPNQFKRMSKKETESRRVQACAGRTPTLQTHDRMYNWIEHEALDVMYEYTGVGLSLGNTTSGKRIEKRRATWRTEGWNEREQAGGSVVIKNKYTECTGSGENCWNELVNKANYTGNWTEYDRERYIEREVRSGVRYERSCTRHYLKREQTSCEWKGTKKTKEQTRNEFQETNNCGSWRKS